jgi:hypothetical protein
MRLSRFSNQYVAIIILKNSFSGREFPAMLQPSRFLPDILEQSIRENSLQLYHRKIILLLVFFSKNLLLAENMLLRIKAVYI